MLWPKPENLPIVQYDDRQKSGHESDTDSRHTVFPSLPGASGFLPGRPGPATFRIGARDNGHGI
jgi:hypothetical protein